jgi:hypothetical protein
MQRFLPSHEGRESRDPYFVQVLPSIMVRLELLMSRQCLLLTGETRMRGRSGSRRGGEVDIKEDGCYDTATFEHKGTIRGSFWIRAGELTKTGLMKLSDSAVPRGSRRKWEDEAGQWSLKPLSEPAPERYRGPEQRELTLHCGHCRL